MMQAAQRKRSGYGAADRLRRGADFDRLFSGAGSRVGRTMVLRGLPSATGRSRCGVIASKRTFRRAVDRNRAKRLLREAFRLDREVLPCACDLVLIARKWILRCDIVAVRKDFGKLVAGLKPQIPEGGRV